MIDLFVESEMLVGQSFVIWDLLFLSLAILARISDILDLRFIIRN